MADLALPRRRPITTDMPNLAHRYAEAALRDWPDAPAFETLREALLEVAARAAAAVLEDVASAAGVAQRAAGLTLGEAALRARSG